MNHKQDFIRKPFVFVCLALFLVLAIGCAHPPTTEMEAAVEAVTRAENDFDAVTYASNSIARAREALSRMQTEASSKRYDTAKSYAAEAIAAAERAINEGKAAAVRARDEATAIVAQLRPLLAETEQGLNAARTAGLPLDFDSLDIEFDNALHNTNEARSALSGNRYQEAIDRGRNARAGLNDINQQLSNVVIATTRKK
jgi:flagellar biosynthesis/type III secretory pathway protein FliH